MERTSAQEMAGAPAVQIQARKRWLTDGKLQQIFLWPTLLPLLFVAIFPLFWSLYLSFTKYRASAPVAAQWVGRKNYLYMLHSSLIWKQFTITAEFVFMAVALEFLAGLGLAMLLNRKFPGRGTVTTLMLMPMMMAPVVVAQFWKLLLNSQFGPIDWLIQKIFGGTPINWLSAKPMSLFSIVLVDAWMWSPFMLLIALAGLSAVPPYLYEAAEVDRASGWFKFRNITLPIIWPLLLIALLFRTMDAFKTFDLAFVLTSGGPGTSSETISITLYKQAFIAFDTGRASALAYIVLIVVIGLSNLYIRYLTRVTSR